jgi:hypothetical protein
MVALLHLLLLSNRCLLLEVIAPVEVVLRFLVLYLVDLSSQLAIAYLSQSFCSRCILAFGILSSIHWSCMIFFLMFAYLADRVIIWMPISLIVELFHSTTVLIP